MPQIGSFLFPSGMTFGAVMQDGFRFLLFFLPLIFSFYLLTFYHPHFDFIIM